MRRFLPILLTLVPLSVSAANDPFYGREIVYVSPEGKPAASVLAEHLATMTGAPFTVAEASAGEVAARDVIQLWSVSEARSVPSLKDAIEKLDPKNVEAFVIRSSADQPGLQIIGNTSAGIRHAAYRYLNELGYRSLFPGPNWQIVPKRNEIRVNLFLADAPYFLQRSFFGTGGFHHKLPLDPEKKIENMWTTWKNANRFGEAMRLPGHYGEEFIQKYRALFEQHPEYRAMVKGERVPMSRQFQINYGNPEVRELYVKDRVESMAKLVEKFPDRIHSISVDPADGYGHCESPEAIALGPISNRVFGLANEVAKQIGEKFPGNYVNLYAYNMHAGTPDFPLEPNVIVSMVPYGFNLSQAQVGDDLVIAWKKVAKQIGIYDYWGIPDWGRGAPGEDFLVDLPRRMKVWVENNVRFFNAETTTGAGATGIPLYLAAKYFWNPKESDYHKELHTFYDEAFGPARAPMQRMLERWSGKYSLHHAELGAIFHNLNEALELAKGRPDVEARIHDFITYAHYLRLLWEFDITPRKSPERIDAANALTRFLWQIRDNAMVQTYRITDLMLYNWMRGIQEYTSVWNLNDAEASGWATVPAYPTTAEIVNLLKDGQATYPFLMEVRSFSSDLVPLSIEYREPAEELASTYTMIKRHNFTFQPLRDGPVEFGIVLHARSMGEEKGIIIVKEIATGKELIREVRPLDGTQTNITVDVKQNTLYRLQVNDRNAHFHVRMPSNLPFVITGGVLQVGWKGRYYFYVPKGTRHFGLFVRNNTTADKTVISVDGFPIEPIVNQGGMTVYEVPAGEDGKAWKVEKFNSDHKTELINVPNILSLSPNNLLVPKEVLE